MKRTSFAFKRDKTHACPTVLLDLSGTGLCGALTAANLVTSIQPLPLNASIEQVLTNAPGRVLVRLRLTDMENQPVEQADIRSRASMPGMLMESQATRVQAQGAGMYLASFQISMPGYWELGFQVFASGFVPTHQTVFLQER